MNDDDKVYGFIIQSRPYKSEKRRLKLALKKVPTSASCSGSNSGVDWCELYVHNETGTVHMPITLLGKEYG